MNVHFIPQPQWHHVRPFPSSWWRIQIGKDDQNPLTPFLGTGTVYIRHLRKTCIYIIMHAHHCMVSANRRTWPGMRQSVIHVMQVLWRRKELFWRMCQCWVDVCLILAATDQFQWPILSSPRPGNGSNPAHLPIHVFVFFLLFFLEIHQHSIETYCRL